MLIYDLALVVPGLFFLIVVWLARTRPLLALLIFFVGPLIGALLSTSMFLFSNREIAGVVPDVSGILLGLALVGSAVFDWAFYPHGVLLGALILLVSAQSARFGGLNPLSKRISAGLTVGVIVGALFGAFVLLANVVAQDNVYFVAFIAERGVEHLGAPPELLISIFTGAADGVLIAIFGSRSSPLKNLAGSLEGVSA